LKMMKRLCPWTKTVDETENKMMHTICHVGMLPNALKYSTRMLPPLLSASVAASRVSIWRTLRAKSAPMKRTSATQ